MTTFSCSLHNKHHSHHKHHQEGVDDLHHKSRITNSPHFPRNFPPVWHSGSCQLGSLTTWQLLPSCRAANVPGICSSLSSLSSNPGLTEYPSQEHPPCPHELLGGFFHGWGRRSGIWLPLKVLNFRITHNYYFFTRSIGIPACITIFKSVSLSTF